MLQYPPRTASESLPVLEFFRESFQEQISACQNGRVRLCVPQLQHLYQRLPGMAFHFKPEVFLQTGGTTEFLCPDTSFELRSSEVCVMPRGVPHGEVAKAGSHPFENIVICLYNKTVTIHVAHEGPDKQPLASNIFFFKSEYFQDFVHLLNRSTALYHTPLCASKTGVKGILMAFFSLLLNMLESDLEDSNPESQRVHQCQWMIRNQLNNPELSVQWLADNLDCTANYLSKIFHDEVEEKITAYITRKRLSNTIDLLGTTTLSVKEISFACGFRDPNYFSRVFKQNMNSTPQEYRHKLLLENQKPEKRPKVVYADHEENHFGFDQDNHLISGV